VAGGLGWYLGLVAYREVLRAVYGQALSTGDATAIRAAVAVAFTLTAPFTVPVVVSNVDRRIGWEYFRPMAGLLAWRRLRRLPGGADRTVLERRSNLRSISAGVFAFAGVDSRAERHFHRRSITAFAILEESTALKGSVTCGDEMTVRAGQSGADDP
jgi:hypothetical protein